MTNKIAVSEEDLDILLDGFIDFIREDYHSCDYCLFCDKKYGNYHRMVSKGEEITHNEGCPVPIADKLRKEC